MARLGRFVCSSEISKISKAASYRELDSRIVKILILSALANALLAYIETVGGFLHLRVVHETLRANFVVLFAEMMTV